MKSSAWRFAVPLACALAGAGACTPYAAEAPEGFATFDDWGSLRAVSPSGVMYRVRGEENEPEADLAFWKEALRKRMQDAGYHFVVDRDVTATGEPGYLLELAAPVGQQDYSYWVAIFVVGDHIVLVEAAGEATRLEKHRDALLAAIAKVRLRS